MTTVLVARGLELRPGIAVPLDDDEVHHLRVRRVPDGGVVALRDGVGLVAEGVVRLAARGVTVETTAARREPRPVPVVLAVGAGEKERFGWLVEKATELGATDVVPVEAAHTAAVASRVRAAHVDRLLRRALEAVKQCGSAWAAVVHEPVPLDRFLAEATAPIRWLADLDGAVPAARLGGEAVAVLIGPEGGLTPAERAAAVAADFRPVRLGGNILRFETAAAIAAGYIAVARARGSHG